MKVKRLKMTSFRGISDLTLDFQTDEPNVLIGINGVGKSSILDCLALLLFKLIVEIHFNPKSRTFSLERQYKYSSLISEREQDLANVLFLNEQDITNGSNETLNEITVSLGSQEAKWSLASVREITAPGGFISGSGQLERVVDEIHSQLKDTAEANIPLAVYYPVNRAVLDIPLDIAEEQSFEQIAANDHALNHAVTRGRIVFDRFFQWFRVLEDLENEERRDNSDYRDRQLEAVRQAISLLMPGFSNLRVRRSPLRMTVEKQGKELIVNQLSDGEKCLLAMVGDLARRLAIANPGLPNPLEGEGVVLIDEIELHLHPKWQREIIPALTRTFPNCQFIITTHSPQVISEVKPNGIYILEATSEGVVAKRPESSYGRDSNRILEDLMGVPARPQEIKDDLLELFRLIDKGDLDGARLLRQQIADEIGSDEPDLVKASVSIRRKEILSR